MKLTRPKTTRQLIVAYGLNWRGQLPGDTVFAYGQNRDHIRVLYFWVPNGSKSQARALAFHEIDIAAAVKLADMA